MEENITVLGLGHKIYASYDNQNIKVYQAYSDTIANCAVKYNKFSEGFSFKRMTWIKPSFLWMMYRSNWAQAEGQKRILSILMRRDVFDLFIREAVLSSYSEKLYSSREQWQELLHKDIRCQWDPERDIFGNPLERRSIQIGIKGKMLEMYNESISSIVDITERVHELNKGLKFQPFAEIINEKEYYFI